MDNRCFVIMPEVEPTGYPQGHFNRVYDYVIIPACRAAGFWPTRADLATYANPLTVIKDMIDCEIVLVDISASNTNALYGLAIRQALNLPVAVAKDMKSIAAFDAAAMGLVEYDDSLRIDTVQKAIELLGEVMKKASENKKDRHELLNRMGIGLPQFTPTPVIDTPTISDEPVVHEKEAEAQLPIISPLPDYVGEPFTEAQIGKLQAGDELFHLRHGKGKVNFLKKMGNDKLASIQFGSGPKLLVLAASNFFRKITKS